jgi:hypothetical protein
MNYVLLIFVFSLMAPQAPEFAGQGPFLTIEDCQKAKAEVSKIVANHNASANPVKAHYYAAECVKVEAAPTGKGV